MRVTHCGVCHSDLSLANGTFPVMAPTVLGHEAAGVVEAVGAGVTGLAAGRQGRAHADRGVQRVLLVPARRVRLLRQRGVGHHRHVPRRAHAARRATAQPVLRGVGLGGFAEYVITPESGAVKVADDTPLEIVCVIGCAVQTGVGAVLNTARVAEGATVLVVGAGGIGIAIVQGARVAGAARIIVSDPVAERRETALRFGATDVIDPTADDVVAARARAHRRHRCRLRVRRGRRRRR